MNKKTTSSYHGHIETEYRENPIHKDVHVPEIHAICVEEIERIVPQMIESACSRMIQGMIGAIQYDVRTCVDIAFDNASDIFHSEKTKKFLSDVIAREMISRLESLDYTFHI